MAEKPRVQHHAADVALINERRVTEFSGTALMIDLLSVGGRFLHNNGSITICAERVKDNN
jgi:hypothetical protein